MKVAEKALRFKWVKLAVESKTLPAPAEIYSIQSVVNKDKKWLHTHGLNRFWLYRIRNFRFDVENADNHYYLIQAFLMH